MLYPGVGTIFVVTLQRYRNFNICEYYSSEWRARVCYYMTLPRPRRYYVYERSTITTCAHLHAYSPACLYPHVHHVLATKTMTAGDINVICRIPIWCYVVYDIFVCRRRRWDAAKHNGKKKVTPDRWATYCTATVGLYVSCNIYIYISIYIIQLLLLCRAYIGLN